jgi:hypothetical protein
MLKEMIIGFMSRIDALSRATASNMARRFIDWKQLPLTPHSEELTAGFDEWTSFCKLRPVQSSYEDFSSYFELYFGLLRAEAYIPLSESVQKQTLRFSARSGRAAGEGSEFSSTVVHPVSITSLMLTRHGLSCTIKLNVSPKAAKSFDLYGRFKFGSLLCLAVGRDFSSVVYGTVTDRDELKNGLLTMKLDTSQGLTNLLHVLATNANGSYCLLESPVYFHAYEAALERLQFIGSQYACLSALCCCLYC